MHSSLVKQNHMVSINSMGNKIVLKGRTLSVSKKYIDIVGVMVMYFTVTLTFGINRSYRKSWSSSRNR